MKKHTYKHPLGHKYVVKDGGNVVATGVRSDKATADEAAIREAAAYEHMKRNDKVARDYKLQKAVERNKKVKR